MYSILRKGLSAVTFSIAAVSFPLVAHAADRDYSLPCVGIEEVLNECYSSSEEVAVEEYLVPTEKGEYLDMAFADVESFLYIRSEPTTQSEWVGKLYPDAAARIIGPVGEWTHIESGSVTGYVYSEYITVGDAADEKAQEMILASRSKTGQASQEASPGTAAEETEGGSEVKETRDESPSGEISTEEGTEEKNQEETEEEVFTFAESKEEEEERIKKEAEEARKREEERVREKAKSGQEVVDYASQFIGNPYVWGGTSLTNGADCSGFVQSVYKHFGVSLPRTSSAQRSAGHEVSYSEEIPGDVICYDGHVGIYMGDGQIVNAINQSKGIGVLSATYANIITVRRIL